MQGLSAHVVRMCSGAIACAASVLALIVLLNEGALAHDWRNEDGKSGRYDRYNQDYYRRHDHHVDRHHDDARAHHRTYYAGERSVCAFENSPPPCQMHAGRRFYVERHINGINGRLITFDFTGGVGDRRAVYVFSNTGRFGGDEFFLIRRGTGFGFGAGGFSFGGGGGRH